MSKQLEIAMSVQLALEDFQRNLASLNSQFKTSMGGLGDDADGAGDAIQAAFKTLGVRSIQEVETEVKKLQAAMATLNSSKMLPADAERASAALNARLIELQGELRGTTTGGQSAAQSIASLGQSSNDAAGALANAAHKAAAWGAALVGLNQISGLAKEIINTGAAFETLEGRLTSLLGSQEAAAAAFTDLKNLAASSPFEVAGLTEAYAKLTAFGLQPTMTQMQAMADTAATLGGGTETLAGVTTALGQAWAKGKLQGEEILQMAERGVPVWAALSEATGKNEQELQRMSAAGELGRETILKLIDALGNQNVGASAELMNTYSGAVANAQDALAEFYSMIASSGVLDYLTTQIRSVLAEFDRMKETGELQAKAQAIADTFIGLADAAKVAFEAISTLAQFMDEAMALFAAHKLLSFVAALREVKTASVAAGAAATVMGGQVAAAGTAAATAGAGVSVLAGALRALKLLTVAGLAHEAVSLAMGFVQARREAAEAGREIEEVDRKIKALEKRDSPENGAVVVLEDSAVAAQSLRFQLSETEKEFIRLKATGQDTGKALEGVLTALDVGSPQGIAVMIGELAKLKGSAQVTGDEIQVALVDRLKKLSAKDLADFGVMAETAFGRGSMKAEQFGQLIDAQVRASLKNLGVDADAALTGMSAKFQESAANVDIVIGRIDRLKAAGVDVGNVLASSLDQALKAATTETAVRAVIERWEALGKQGAVTGKQLADGLTVAQRKLDDIKPGVNSLAEAFRALGMKSQEDLNKTAENARQAFETIKQGSGSTRQEVERVGEAFKRYAEAAIAANGGVITDAVRAEAAMRGFRIEVDASGKSMLVAANSTDGLAGGLRNVANEASAAAAQVAEMQKVYDRMTKLPPGTVSPSVMDSDAGSPSADAFGFSWKDELYRAGATVKEAEIAAKYTDEIKARLVALRSPSVRSEAEYFKMHESSQRNAVEQALALARAEIAGATVDIGTSVADERARIAARQSAPMTADGYFNNMKSADSGGARAAMASTTVVFNVAGRQTKVNVGSSSDVENLRRILQQLEFDASRSN